MSAADDTTTASVVMDDGAKLHVKVLGDSASTTNEKPKPLLISLHSAPGVSDHSEPEAAYAFLSGAFRVLVYDARGSGASDHVGPYNHERWINDIENLRQWAGADKFVLAGASYGGFVALDYAVRHGDRLTGLILRGAWANGKFGPMQTLADILTSNQVKVDTARQVRLWSGTLLDDHDLEGAIRELIPFFAPPPRDLPSKVEVRERAESAESQQTVVYDSATHNYAFSVNMPRFDVRQQLQTIEAPTLVVVGRHDHVTPVAASQEIADGVPHARLEVFEHSGHSPPSDEPERFERVVLDWLRNQRLVEVF